MDDTAARVTALARWPADPRVATWLVAQLDAVPFTSNSSRPFWQAAIDLVPVHGDARVVAAARALSPSIRAQMREWIAERLAPAADALAARIDTASAALAKPERALVAKWSAALAPTAAAPPGDGDALLAQIYADAADDGARAAYADWCQERGDPRGEFIALQLATKRTPQLERRERELLKAHETAWLGALAPHLVKGEVTFRRGFPAVATWKLRRADVAKAGALREWATIEELSLGAGMQWVGPAQRHLRALRNVKHCVDDVVAMRWERLDTLDGKVWDDAWARKLVAADCFPALRRFLVQVEPEILVAAKLAPQLTHVETDNLPRLLELGLDRFTALEEIVWDEDSPQNLKLSRDKAGAFSIAIATLHAGGCSEVLRKLPGDQLTEITFVPHPYVPKVDLAVVDEQLRRQVRLVRADTTALGGRVQTWKPRKYTPKPRAAKLPELGEIAELAWTSRGELAMFESLDETIAIRNAETWEQTRAIELPNGVKRMACTPDGRRGIVMSYKGVWLLDFERGERIAELQRIGEPESIAVADRGDAFAVGAKQLLLFDATGTRLATINVAKARRIAYSPDATRIACRFDMSPELHVIDVARRTTLALPKAPAALHDLAWLDDRRIIASGYAEMYLWDITSDKPPRLVKATKRGDGHITAIALAPGRGELAVGLGIGGGVHFLDTAKLVVRGRAVADVEVDDSIAYSPDGKTLAVNHKDRTSRGIVLVDVATRAELRRNVRVEQP
jgi:uncharacterized protein (TIGR02996 family)